MRKATLLFIFFIAINVKSNDLPKVCYGQYDAMMPAFEFEDNNKIHKASAYKVSIRLTPGVVYYTCGSLSFTGTYSNVDQEKEEISMLVSISNSISINFDFNVMVNKKTRNLKISGLTGLPDTEMVKRQIVLKRKSSSLYSKVFNLSFIS